MSGEAVAVSQDIVGSEDEPLLYLGPSHVQRLDHAFRTSQLPPRPSAAFAHAGGLPIWAPEISHALKNHPGYSPRFVVGDFRFGNKIIDKIGEVSAYPKQGRRVGVRRDLINDDNDQKMYRFSIAAIDRIQANFPEARLLFWDLLVREFRNRRAGHYGIGADYRHPVWNMSDVLARYRDMAIDVTPLLDDPIVDKIAIDNSGHPSLKGWSFILNVLDGLTVAQAKDVIADMDRAIVATMFCAMPDTIILGDGELLDNIRHLLSIEALTLPGRVRIAHNADIDEALETGALVLDVVSLRAVGGSGNVEEAYRRRVRKARARVGRYSRFSNYKALLWTPWAQELIAKRIRSYGQGLPTADDLQYPYVEKTFGSAVVPLTSIPPRIADGMVQLHNGLDITQFGIMALMTLVGYGRVGVADVERYLRSITPFFDVATNSPASGKPKI